MSSDLSVLAPARAPSTTTPPAVGNPPVQPHAESAQAKLTRAVAEGRIGPPPTFDVNALQQLMFQRTKADALRADWPRDDHVAEAASLDLKV